MNATRRPLPLGAFLSYRQLAGHADAVPFDAVVDQLRRFGAHPLIRLCAAINRDLARHGTPCMWEEAAAQDAIADDWPSPVDAAPARRVLADAEHFLLHEHVITWLLVLATSVCPDEGEDIASASSKRRIARVIAILNDHIAGSEPPLPEEPTDQERRRSFVPSSLRCSQFNARLSVASFVARHARLYLEIAPTVPTGSFSPDALFRARYGVDLDEYFHQFLVPLVMAKEVAPEPRGGPVSLTLNDSKLYENTTIPRERVSRWFSSLVHDVESLRAALRIGPRQDGVPNPFWLRPLREKPLLRLDERGALVTNPRFLAHRISEGLYYDGLEQLKASGVEGRVAAITWGGWFGQVVDKYVKEAVERILPQPPGSVLAPRRWTDIDEPDREYDAIIACPELLVAMEAKAMIFNEDVLTGSDFEASMKRLDAVFFGGRRGAIAQISRCIDEVRDGTLASYGLTRELASNVQPVVVLWFAVPALVPLLQWLDERAERLSLLSQPGVRKALVLAVAELDWIEALTEAGVALGAIFDELYAARAQPPAWTLYEISRRLEREGHVKVSPRPRWMGDRWTGVVANTIAQLGLTR